MKIKRKSSLPEYAAWASMRSRCSNPNATGFKHYGGRGISVCERWLVFENFFADMGSRPTPKHTLDRIDVNGNYAPENCRWATWSEQRKNRRDAVLPENRQEVVLSMRVSADEREEILAACRATGLLVGAFIRAAVLEGIK